MKKNVLFEMYGCGKFSFRICIFFLNNGSEFFFNHVSVEEMTNSYLWPPIIAASECMTNKISFILDSYFVVFILFCWAAVLLVIQVTTGIKARSKSPMHLLGGSIDLHLRTSV